MANQADTYTTEAIACGLSDVAGWLENEGGREKHARTIRLGVERLRELGAAAPPASATGAEGDHRELRAVMRRLLAAKNAGGIEDAETQAQALGHAVDTCIGQIREFLAAPSHPGKADRGGLREPSSARTMRALKELSDAATPGLWYTVDTPWGDGTWIVAGNPDPHAGTMVCDCQDMNESRPEDGPGPADDAAFIATLVTAYRLGELVPASLAALGTGEGSGGAPPAEQARRFPEGYALSPGAIARAMDEDGGWWSSCAGCHETVDGHDTGDYPWSEVFRCHVGSGCTDCGGLGVTWSYFTDEQFAEMGKELSPHPQAPNTLSEVEEARALLEKEKRAYNGNPSEIIKYLRWRADLVLDDPEMRLELLTRADRIEAALASTEHPASSEEATDAQ